MRLLALIVAVLIALLAGNGSATGASQGGYDVPTRMLESAFKLALYDRAGSPDGCYPSEEELIAQLRKKTNLKLAIANGFKGVRRAGVVYILRRSNCNRLVEATRFNGRLFVLDSNRGPVYIPGKQKPAIGTLRKLTGVRMLTGSFQLNTVDDVERLLLECPRGTFPLGGGMVPAKIEADGEGAYPHSYERLGAQEGWHVSAVLIDPSPSSTTNRRVTVQVLCGRGVGEPIGPRRTVFLRSGQSKSVTARCPAKTYLIAGGFQRTDFRTPGGDYITESRAISPKAWRVSGHAFGAFGGELTAMAYCVRHKGPVFTTVSGSNPVPLGQSATATTPGCPKGRKLTAGGFSMNGSDAGLFAGSAFNDNGTYSATGFGYFGAAPSITAYGYCVPAAG